MNTLYMLANDVVTTSEETPKSYTLLYIIVIALIIGISYFIDNKKNIDITDLSLNNPFLIGELVLISSISSIFGINYLVFSFYILYFIIINIIYVKNKIGTGIEDERLLVKTIFIYFAKKMLIMFIATIPLSIFASYNVIAFYLAFILACILMITLRIIVKTKDEELYKLMPDDQVKKLLGDFYTDTLFKSCYNTYMIIQKELASNTINNAEKYLSSDMLPIYLEKQKDILNKQARLIIDEESYISGGLIKYSKINNIEYFYIELVYNIKSYIANMETGNVIEGSSTRLKKITSLMEFNKIDDVFILKSEKIFKEE